MRFLAVILATLLLLCGLDLRAGLPPVMVFVHGIDFETSVSYWDEPIALAKQAGIPVHFFKWSKTDSMKSLAERLASELTRLSRENPQRRIVVAAHSAGGIIGLLALEQLQAQSLAPNVYLHTMATPYFGYQAPRGLAYLGSPFVGQGTIDIGVGAFYLMGQKELRSCTNWVNQSCSQDNHVCSRGGVSPELGPIDQPYVHLPCRTENGQLSVQALQATNHENIIPHVVNQLIRSSR